MTRSRFGLSCAVATPFRADMSVDLIAFRDHILHLLANGCDSVTAFGTTGEGSSLGMAERIAMLAALDAAGIDMRRQVVGGVMATSPREAAEQLRLLYDANCRAVLLAPPYFFKGVSDEGVYAWVAALIEQAGARARDIILYHIPQMTGVRFSIALVDRLKRAFPGVIIGVKDSAAIWPETEALVRAHGDLAILVGDERHLGPAVKLGGQGAICGFANMIPQSMRAVAHEGTETPDIEKLHRVMADDHFLGVLKAVLAHQHGNPGWHRLRPPLVNVEDNVARRVVERFKREFA